jgi:hypothetical protein
MHKLLAIVRALIKRNASIKPIDKLHISGTSVPAHN